MAVTISRYNHTARRFLNKEVDTSNIKVMLLNAAASFGAAQTQLTQVTNAGANQVSGNGWPSGGVTLSGVTITTVSTNGAMIDAADIEITATGGDIGPTFAAVIYDDATANDPPLWYIDFGGSQTAGAGTPFKIAWSANGIARVN
jgi:hypothetical protein